MNRRNFNRALAGALVAASDDAFCQQSVKATNVYRIGVLSLTSFGNTTLAKVLVKPLEARGLIVGRDITWEERVAEGNAERLPSLAAELVRLNVDLIVAGPAVAIRAAHNATTTIPIVMAFSGDDPVTSGFVASLARPGGNVTGVTAQVRDFAPKWLELLRDVLPGITRIAVLTNPARPEHLQYAKMLEAARPPGVQLQTMGAGAPDQYEAAFAEMSRERANALIILGDVVFSRDSGRLAALALAHRLPSIYLFRDFVVSGGLLAYGPDEGQLLELAALYIDKILKGANPAELPVEQPTRFRLAINLKTARTLGLTIPEAVRLRADDVIQ